MWVSNVPMSELTREDAGYHLFMRLGKGCSAEKACTAEDPTIERLGRDPARPSGIGRRPVGHLRCGHRGVAVGIAGILAAGDAEQMNHMAQRC
jgi:hypothetical protein